MPWGSDEEGKPAGGDAGSTIDNECQAWWVRIRKFLGILVTDTSDTALGSGADEDNPAIKDGFVDDSTIEKGSETQIQVKDGGITLAKHASDSVDENKIVSTTLGAGLVGGSGTTLSVDGVVEKGAGTHEMYPKVVDIGDWNMDTTATVAVTHGLGANWKKIRSVTVTVRNDDDNNCYSGPVGLTGAGMFELGVVNINATIVNVNRLTGGRFDSASFNATAFNRGWVMLWCEV